MAGDYTLNSESNSFSRKGFVVLIVILVIVSIIAYALSSIEGFLTGIVVIFIGFLLSFFRDDLRRMLGLTSKDKIPAPIIIETSDVVEKLDTKITKERQNIAKLISKHEAKPKKQQKIALDIVEEATALIALIDQAKSQAIQRNDASLVEHYEGMAQEIQGIRERYSI